MAPMTELMTHQLLSTAEQTQRWHDYVNGGDYTSEQKDALVAQLFGAHQQEFNALLSQGCFWHPGASQIVGPVGAKPWPMKADEDSRQRLQELMDQAADAVIARYDAIEAEALAVVTLTVVEGEQPQAHGVELGECGLEVTDAMLAWAQEHGYGGEDDRVWVLVTPHGVPSEAVNVRARQDFTVSAQEDRALARAIAESTESQE